MPAAVLPMMRNDVWKTSDPKQPELRTAQPDMLQQNYLTIAHSRPLDVRNDRVISTPNQYYLWRLGSAVAAAPVLRDRSG